MRLLAVAILLLLSSRFVGAASPTAAQQIRAIELQREAQERERQIEQARRMYFERIALDVDLDFKTRVQAEKIISRYKKRFISFHQADTLCQELKVLVLPELNASSKVSCAIENMIFTFQITP